MPRSSLPMILPVACAAAALAGLALHRAGDSGPPGAAGVGCEASPTPAALVAAPAAPPQRVPAAHVAPATADGRIVGRLVSAPDGAPLAGVAVVAWQVALDGVAPRAGALLAGRSTAAEHAAAHAASAADGRFELAGLERHASTRLAVAAGTPRARVVPVEAALPAGRALHLGDLALAQGTTVRGRVLGPRGQPVADAWVAAGPVGRKMAAPPVELLLLPGPPARVLEGDATTSRIRPDAVRTDARGQFALCGVSGAGVRVAVHAAGLRSRALDVDLGVDLDGAEIEVGDLRLEPLGAVPGRVRDARGRPVAGARVRVASSSTLARLGTAFGHPLGPAERTASDGRFAAAAAPGSPRLVAVRTEESPFWHVAGPFDKGAPLEVALPARASGLVELQTEDGAPVGHIRAGIQPCGADGASLDPFASMLGFRWAMRQGRALPAGLRLAPAADLLRRVPGQPATWRLEGLLAGDYRLLVEVEGFAPAGGWIRLQTERDSRLVLALSRPVARRIEVVDRRGAAIAGARVLWHADAPAMDDGVAARPLPASPIPVALGTSDHDGRVESRALGRRSGVFLVEHPDFVPAEHPAPEQGGASRVALVRYGAIEGRVEGGDPARLVVIAALRDAPHAVSASSTARVGVDGGFALPRLAPGSWRLAVLPRSGGPREALPLRGSAGAALAEVEVAVSPGERARAALRVAAVPAGGRIVGSVAVLGEPGARMAVRAWPLGPLAESAPSHGEDDGGGPGWTDRARTVRTGADGAFEIAGLPPGHYRVSVADLGVVHHPLWATRVRLDRGATRACHAELRLGEVRLSVRDPRDRPVEGMEVLLVGRAPGPEGWQGTGLHHRAWTDARGRAVLSRVPAGRYQLSGRCEGGPLVVEPRPITVGRQVVEAALAAQRRS